MRILFISGELAGSALCQKLVSEGNDVRLFILRDDWKSCYTGLVQKTDDWKAELNWVQKDGLIIFDDVVFGEEQDALRAQGYTVIGGSAGGDALERDRKLFQDVLEAHGVASLPSYYFSDVDEAIHFIKENPDKWVTKQTSHVSSFNFIGQSPDGSDAIRVLERYKERGISPLYLQKYVQGVEVGVARYFNGNDWVGPIEVNHEHKRLQDGDIGPLTPEMGTILWYTDKEIPLFTKTLAKLKPYLQQIDFRGDFDINFIVNEQGAWPLEATPRFGCPSTEIQIALHKSPWTEFLTSIGKGEPYSLSYRKGIGIAVCMVTAPYPYTPTPFVQGATPPKIHISSDATEEDMMNIHFEEVSKHDGEFYWSGKYGQVLHVTAHNEVFHRAQHDVYSRVSKVSIPGVYYRKDIGNRVLIHDIPYLERLGWL